MKKINCVFIGEKFYYESQTFMSSLYRKAGINYFRYSYGDLQTDLSNGHEVTIKPATEKQLEIFKRKLELWKNNNL